MIFIRSLIFFLFFILSTLSFAGFGFILCWFMPVKQRFIVDTTWSRLNLWALKIICGLSYRIEGEENLKKQPCIILSNHQSAWETIALASLVDRPKVWVLKRELIYIPIFGWVMYHFKPIAIDRKAGRKAVRQIVEQGTQRLKEGFSVIIFPEGTRIAPEEKKRFGIGGAMLAEHSGFPVIPIAHNAGVFWKRRGIIKYPGVIDVRVGPILEFQNRKAVAINKQVEAWIDQTKATLPLYRESQKSS
jgi:1-acyl-sn-glycerol-3-phosphate acyltransferase